MILLWFCLKDSQSVQTSAERKDPKIVYMGDIQMLLSEKFSSLCGGRLTNLLAKDKSYL